MYVYIYMYIYIQRTRPSFFLWFPVAEVSGPPGAAMRLCVPVCLSLCVCVYMCINDIF